MALKWYASLHPCPLPPPPTYLLPPRLPYTINTFVLTLMCTAYTHGSKCVSESSNKHTYTAQMHRHMHTLIHLYIYLFIYPSLCYSSLPVYLSMDMSTCTFLSLYICRICFPSFDRSEKHDGLTEADFAQHRTTAEHALNLFWRSDWKEDLKHSHQSGCIRH